MVTVERTLLGRKKVRLSAKKTCVGFLEFYVDFGELSWTFWIFCMDLLRSAWTPWTIYLDFWESPWTFWTFCMDFWDLDFRDLDFQDLDFQDLDFRDLDFWDLDFRDLVFQDLDFWDLDFRDLDFLHRVSEACMDSLDFQQRLWGVSMAPLYLLNGFSAETFGTWTYWPI